MSLAQLQERASRAIRIAYLLEPYQGAHEEVDGLLVSIG